MNELLKDIDAYKKKFPESLTYEQIIDKLKYQQNEQIGILFGYDVSPKWDGKCYGFEVKYRANGCTYFNYIGICKV